MRNLFFLFIVFVAVSCQQAPRVLSEREFTEVYRDSLLRRYPEATFVITANLAIDGNYKGKSAKHFLDNAYKDYKMRPDSIVSVIQHFMASSSYVYHLDDEVEAIHIIPVIKPAGYLTDVLRQMGANVKKEDLSVVYDEYNDQLIVMYMVDSETSLRSLTKTDLSKLGISKDTLLNMAVRNLRAVLPEVKLLGDSDTYMITAGGNFEVSLILFPKIWTKENLKVNGDFVIAIPNRDLLLVTGSKNSKGISKLKELIANSYTNGNYPISDRLFRWNGKKFEVFD